MSKHHFPLLVALVLLGSPGSRIAGSDQIDFNRDIQPILAERCFACHGPNEETREADLRFDQREGAISDLGGYQAISPGDAAASAMVERIESEDEFEVMPPPSAGKKLTAAEIDRLKQWINQGAPYAEHWAFRAPTRPTAPDTPSNGWQHNPIDQFVWNRLAEEGLTPSPQADQRTLIRRLYFDLIGLPPTPQEFESFSHDFAPRAYDGLVETLLDSPHYGEQMTAYWLDLVRYADSVGYHGDQPMPVSPYRDYVIRAFNDDMPFDQFTREQLAGDLLPTPTAWQQIATAYNRLNQKTAEGGAQDKEYLAIYQADRIRNVSEVWLGLTMGCCQCHDHKFDPLTTKDFYSLGAFFADITQKGFYANAHATAGWGTSIRVPEADRDRQIEVLDRQITKLKADLKRHNKELDAEQLRWEETQREQFEESGQVQDQVWIDDQNVPKGERSGEWNYVGQEVVTPHSGQQARRQSGNGLVQHYVLGAADTLHLNSDATLYAYVYLDAKDPPSQIMLQFNDGTWEHRAFWGSGEIPFGVDGTVSRQSMGELPKLDQWIRLEVPIAKVGLKQGANINGMAFTQWGGTAYWDQAGVNQSDSPLSEKLQKTLATPRDKRSPEEAEQLDAYYRTIAPQLVAIKKSLAELESARKTLVDGARRCLITVPTDPMTVRILSRGNWQDESGAVVQPAIPDMFGRLDQQHTRASRLDLANWLVSGKNPLTARVFVNRLWYRFFGRGISSSLGDFGTQGDYPTHPELLDWLAAEFVDSGWSVKHVVRLIVTSATYRQSSHVEHAARERDPFNTLLARQGRFRLSAEVIRDNALSFGDLLVDTVGGPSVKPYQPAGYWQHLNFPKRTYDPSHGDALWRRSLYTHWQRSFLHPSLRAFDAPAREECTVARPRSNTPLQALVLLNDPIFVEAARALGERMLQEGGDSDASRIDFACRTALQRSPSTDELSTLQDYYREQRRQIARSPDAAVRLSQVGDRPVPDTLPADELAAATAVVRVLLNLHETISRY